MVRRQIGRDTVTHQAPISAPWWQVLACWLAFAVMPLSLIACVDMGGSIRARLSDLDPAPIYGTCASACTMRLKVACVSPGARLGFHGATSGAVAWGTATMADHYPPALKAWYLAGPARGVDVVWITGRDAVGMGARACWRHR